MKWEDKYQAKLEKLRAVQAAIEPSAPPERDLFQPGMHSSSPPYNPDLFLQKNSRPLQRVDAEIVVGSQQRIIGMLLVTLMQRCDSSLAGCIYLYVQYLTLLMIVIESEISGLDQYNTEMNQAIC